MKVQRLSKDIRSDEPYELSRVELFIYKEVGDLYEYVIKNI